MNRKTAERIVADYEALLAKALAILGGDGPPYGFVGHPEFAKLQFDGEFAIILHPETDTSYDCCTIEEDTESFPAALLFMSDAELQQWRAKEKAEIDKRELARRAKMIAAREAEERRVFKALKAKYDTSK